MKIDDLNSFIGSLSSDLAKATEPVEDRFVVAAAKRFLLGLPMADTALGLPCRYNVEHETLEAIYNLTSVGGMTLLKANGFEVANNREIILRQALELGFKKLLFLDSDTVVSLEGVQRMRATMARCRTAMVTALVVMRPKKGQQVAEYATFLGDDTAMRAMVDEDIPMSLAPFEPHYSGMACALIDLDLIRANPGEGSWFKRHADGTRHVTEDYLFCRKLREVGLDFFLDPSVMTGHVLPRMLSYIPKKTEG